MCGGSAGVLAESGVCDDGFWVGLQVLSYAIEQQHQQRGGEENRIEADSYSFNTTIRPLGRILSSKGSNSGGRGTLDLYAHAAASPCQNGNEATNPELSMIRPGWPDVDPGWLSQFHGGSRC